MRYTAVALIARLVGGRRLLLVVMGLLVGALALLLRDRWKEGAPAPGQGSDREEVRAEENSQALVRRLLRKERVIQALLAGRLSLLEAAAHFHAMHREPPRFY